MGRSAAGYFKDGIGECIVHGNRAAVNPEERGTKAAAHYRLAIEPGKSAVVELRLADSAMEDPFGPAFGKILLDRADDANDFYATVTPRDLSIDARAVMRQAFAGMLWSKQYYHYVVRDWLRGRSQGAAAASRAAARPQPPMDAPLQCRRDLHAGQVGVSLVRRLGPGVPLPAAGAGGFATSPRNNWC